MTVRSATLADLAELHAMICELADYERLNHEVQASIADTERALFGERPAAEALVVELKGAVAGFALFYPYYSTFAGRTGLYLEDIFVREKCRRQGLGEKLIREFLRLAHDRGCPKVEWRVLRWNEPALEFYRSLGAEILDDWVPARVVF